jgi:hypothetical protein
MSLDFRVWQDGKFQDPEIDEPSPQQDSEWIRIDGTDEAFIEMRFKDGVKLYRSVAVLSCSEEYPGEKHAISGSFEAFDAADTEPVDAYAHFNPGLVQAQRNTAAAIARSHMDTSTQAALSDMRKIANELLADLEYPYKAWQQRNERHVALLRASEPLCQTVQAMAADIKEFGMQPEYIEFAKQLQFILKGQK